MKISILSCVGLLFASLLEQTQAAITTEYLAANGLNFTCTVLKHTSEKPDAPTKELMLLHGFPMFRVWWDPLLQHWDNLLKGEGDSTTATARAAKPMSPVSVHAVACDLRGYSPGASPDNIEDYDYSIFAQDTFALAEAAGFENGFHLLGHDHGAALAWYIAGNDPNNQVLSLTTLSVPHIGAFSDALCGENEDNDQVIASNYFNQFSLPDSAFRNNASLTAVFEGFGMGPLDPVQFQKMLWWYNGSLAKHFSMPRVVSDAEVDEYEATYGPELAFFLKSNRAAIPMEERPCIPIEEENRIGSIEVPTLFVCGLGDSALLCNNEYVTNFPPELLPNYEHVNFQCGHDFFLEGNCNTMEESKAVMEKITAFLFADDNTASDGEETTTTTPSDVPSQEELEDDVDDSSSASNILNLARKVPMLIASGGAMMASTSLFW